MKHTNIRRHRTEFSHRGDLYCAICTPPSVILQRFNKRTEEDCPSAYFSNRKGRGTCKKGRNELRTALEAESLEDSKPKRR
jgi:hypothetical protein